jgi:hypothetical protein
VAAINGPISGITGSTIEIDLVRPPELGSAYCNIRELENEILNLALNAKDAMPNGGGLGIAAMRASNLASADNGGPRPIPRVIDTGCGTSTRDAKRAFTKVFHDKNIEATHTPWSRDGERLREARIRLVRNQNADGDRDLGHLEITGL